MQNDNFIYGDDEDKNKKDYLRVYLFGGYCLLIGAILIIGLLVKVILWIKSIVL